MAIVTLTTGWVDDFYVAAMKGILLSGIPSVQVIDMSHNTPTFSTGISYAAYLVKQSYKFFPANTIHIISVTSEFHKKRPFLAAYYNEHYFLGTDNGLFGLLFDSSPENMVRIEKFSDELSPNYPALSVFAPAAVHLANQGDISHLGSEYTDYQRSCMALATISSSQITGTIIYINAFGNVITNITRDDFDRVCNGREFEILLQRTKRKITRISKYFQDVSEGELLAVFNISGFLEIAMNKGKVAEMFRLELDANIMIKFFDK